METQNLNSKEIREGRVRLYMTDLEGNYFKYSIVAPA